MVENKIKKTVLISSASNDFPTNEVVEWLQRLDCKVIRLNDDEPIKVENIILDNDELVFEIVSQNKTYHFTQNTTFWYRRGHINFFGHKKELDFSNELNRFIAKNKKIDISLGGEIREMGELFDAILGEHLNIKGLGAFDNNRTIKLLNQHIAAKCGLKIPRTGVFSKKKGVIDFFSKCKSGVITKAMRGGATVYNKEFIYAEFTEEITKQDISELEDEFFPLLLQEKLDKLLEIRAFYLEDTFYSSAIFSQKDTQTKVDFRHYNEENPNRTPPFQLPKEIENKLSAVMKQLKMKSGSLDIILTPAGGYYFLEVNPVGQFTQVSKPCNYYLEEKVAKYLAKL